METAVAESKEAEQPVNEFSHHFKAGQRYATPSPGSGDRVFYETLLNQKPDSEMAQEWCVAYGVLDGDRAEVLYHAILNRKGKKKELSNSPAVKKKRPVEAISRVPSGKPRKIRDDDDIVGDTGEDLYVV